MLLLMVLLLALLLADRPLRVDIRSFAG